MNSEIYRQEKEKHKTFSDMQYLRNFIMTKHPFY